MKVVVETVTPSVRRLQIELPYGMYEDELAEAFRRLSRRVSVPGFRKGKVPRKILERHYRQDVEMDVLNRLVPATCEKAIKEQALAAVSPPKVDDIQVDRELGLRLSVTVEVRPEITLPDPSGWSFTREVRRVTDADVQAELERLREATAQYVTAEGARVAEGDLVVLGYKPYAEGVLLEKDVRERETLLVGSHPANKRFEEQILGAEAGEERDVTVEYPEDEEDKEIAGKRVRFRTKIHEVKKKSLPTIDDDFAKELGDYETLEELRGVVRERLEEKEQREARERLEGAIVDRFLLESPFEAPEGLVEREIDRMLLETQERFHRGGVHLRLSKEDYEAFRAKLREPALKRVKAGLLLEKVADQRHIEVADEELEAEIQRLAVSSKQNPIAYRTNLEKSGAIELIRGNLLRRRMLETLVENLAVEEKWVDRLPEQAAQGAASEQAATE